MAPPQTPTGTVAVPQPRTSSYEWVAQVETVGRTHGRRARVSNWLLVAVLLTVILGALSDDRPLARNTPAVSSFAAAPPAEARPHSFDSYFEWAGLLPVQENDSALVVKPIVTEDPEGGLLVADSRESQVRRVSPAGTLLTYFGRPGEGPNEFRGLSSVVRLNTGEVLTTEISGRVTLTNDRGDKARRVVPVGIEPLYAATVLDDSTVILTGLREGKLVHLWDPRRAEIRASFYPVPEHPAEFDNAYSFTGFSAVAVQHNMIVVLFALSDELRFFHPDGTEDMQMRMKLPYRDFRYLREGQPENSSPEAFRVWAESYSVGSRIYWLRDGSFVIQYFDRVGSEQKWSTLHVDRFGRSLFEGQTPKLLTVLRTPARSALLFAAAENAEPNQWRLANFRFSAR